MILKRLFIVSVWLVVVHSNADASCKSAIERLIGFQLELTRLTDAVRPHIEQAISDPSALQTLLSYTDNGAVYHGTNLNRGIAISKSDLKPSLPTDDISGFYTIANYGRALEYAVLKGRFAASGGPVVLEFRINPQTNPRILLIGKELSTLPEFLALERLLEHNRNVLWSHLSEAFRIDATVDVTYPVFFSRRVLEGPDSLASLATMLEARMSMPVIDQPIGYGSIKSDDVARYALEQIKRVLEKN